MNIDWSLSGKDIFVVVEILKKHLLRSEFLQYML